MGHLGERECFAKCSLREDNSSASDRVRNNLMKNANMAYFSGMSMVPPLHSGEMILNYLYVKSYVNPVNCLASNGLHFTVWMSKCLHKKAVVVRMTGYRDGQNPDSVHYLVSEILIGT